MNYIQEIKAFYDRLELNPQPNQAIALWHALMSIANKAGWPDTFTVASSILGLRSGLSASGIKRARNQLAQDNFIEWKPRGGNLSAVYKINTLVVQYEPQIAPQIAPQGEPQNVPQNELQSGLINKLKLKQEKKKDTNVSKESHFAPPTLKEIKAYCLERNNTVDAQRFIDFYSSKGWLIGKNKMVDWKAAVRTWEKGENQKNGRTGISPRTVEKGLTQLGKDAGIGDREFSGF